MSTLHLGLASLAIAANLVCSIEATAGILLAVRCLGCGEEVQWLFFWYLVLNLIAQLPKRYLYRNRPWRKRVAVAVTKD